MTQPRLEQGPEFDAAPEDQVMVALDLETTGLNAESDSIIEVGAVKFRGDEELDTFSSLVNPFRRVSRFISELTGIQQSDLDSAPSWDSISGQLALFLSNHPLIGHRVDFDIGFLKSHSLTPSGASYDTHELASVLIPAGPDYSLGGLTTRFKVGHDSPHRALSDAIATRDLFKILLANLRELDPGVLRQLEHLGRTSGWSVGELARRVIASLPSESRRSALGPLGVDYRELGQRLRVASEDGDGSPIVHAETGQIADVFAPGGHLEANLLEYEHRPQQVDMAQAVADAIAEGRHLLIEAGTGVGKSLAYLVPGALRALDGGDPIVISTNTINLQEQLVQKDIPALERVLAALGIPEGSLKVAQLKGRANYLCFRRWSHAHLNSEPDAETVRVMGKCLVWLQSTSTGDRSELALPRGDGSVFSRISAQGAQGCPVPTGPCFLRRARYGAGSAHIVVINHALLMSDLAMGGGIVPAHSALVIDEAHHLEGVATRHLGFQIAQGQLESELQSLESDRGPMGDAVRAATEGGRGGDAAAEAVHVVSEVRVSVGRARSAVSEFYDQLGRVIEELLPRGGGGNDVRITPTIRSLPAWSDVAVTWENMDLAAGDVARGLRSLSETVSRAAARTDDAAEATLLNLSAAIESIEEAQAGLRQAVSEPGPEMIYWLFVRRMDGSTTVNAAPLRVGPMLSDQLFANERSVVLTSGSLTTGEGFTRIRDNLGIANAEEVALGSPFDYRSAALVAVGDDLPEPGREGYNGHVAAVVRDLAVATRDRILVLFTSNSALQTAREALRESLSGSGIRVVGQGPDGTPYRIMRALAENPQTVALGSSSLWEGVDLEGASIKTLVMARLPFPVPTDPVFEARSEQYQDSFDEYAVPEAVMRFKQGFGRLIRSRSDRGAFVVLDSRIANKRYGGRFLSALPDCTVEQLPGRAIGKRVKEWLG